MLRSLSIVLASTALAGCAPQDSRETNKAIVRNYMEKIVNQGNPGLWDIYFPAEISFNGQEIPPQNLMELVDTMRARFPDLHLTIEDQYALRDIVVTRVTFEGTHLGEADGVPPTGRKVRFIGIAIDRLVADKVVEMWHAADDGAVRKLLRQP